MSDLPPSLAALIEPELPALADDIIREIGREVPEYARPLEGPFGEGLRIGVRTGLGRFAALIADPDAVEAARTDVYVALGRGELEAGRSLDALQAAYRVGARVAWRGISRALLRAEVDPAVLARVAEAIFAYIEEISAASTEGYAAAQSERAGERDRRRRRLLGLLLADAPADPLALRDAATVADWSLPATLAALAWDPDAGGAPGPLPIDALAGLVDRWGCALIPDPLGPGRPAQVRAACAGARVAIGPPVAPAEAGRSWQRARATLRAAPAEPGLHDSSDHLLAILLEDAAPLIAELADARLAPLADMTPNARARMEQTLLAWLRAGRSAPAAAEALHVHAQTVRYRLGKLRELFGTALEDPDTRFELELALRARAQND